MSEGPTTLPTRTTATDEYLDAFLYFLPEFEAVEDSETRTVNLNIARMCDQVLWASTRLAYLVPDIERELPLFDVRIIEELPRLAAAVRHADLLALHTDDAGEAPYTYQQMRRTRGHLARAARQLAEAGLLPEDEVKRYGSTRRAPEIVEGIFGLIGLFLEHWEDVRDKTIIEAFDLEEAHRRASAMRRHVGVQDRLTVADLRDRAFTVLVDRYAEIQRAVRYLRFYEGDADQFAPTLYARRKARLRAVSTPLEQFAVRAIESRTPSAVPANDEGPLADVG